MKLFTTNKDLLKKIEQLEERLVKIEKEQSKLIDNIRMIMPEIIEKALKYRNKNTRLI